MTRIKGDLYLLQDGTHADPSDVSPDNKGVLRHKNGLAVCLYEDGSPQTVGGDAVINKNVEAANAGKVAVAASAAKQNDEKSLVGGAPAPSPVTLSEVKGG